MTNENLNKNPLDALGVRVSSNPFFFASMLAAYQERHGLDDDGLAALLGCSLDVLTDLRLCRRPGAAAPRWTVEEDIARIAGHFSIDAAALHSLTVTADGTLRPAAPLAARHSS
ncbi:MAG: hypothetical protein HYS12_23505 [Planctomycetes bacterium]|nr:hypothetical protein [Planctomycetota bacterium]